MFLKTQINPIQLIRVPKLLSIRNKSYQKSSMDVEEVKHFNQFCETWWDINGVLKPLHTLNKLRTPLFVDSLVDVCAIEKQVAFSETPLFNKHVLDVGCGGGILTEALGKLGGIIDGLEVSEEIVNCANLHVNKSNLTNVKYIFSKIEDFAPKNLEKYDIVITSEVLEHITEKEMFLKACIQCMRPGGSILLTTLNRSVWTWITYIAFAQVIFNVIPRGTHSWRKFITPIELEEILKKYNCNTVDVKGFYFNFLNYKWHMVNHTSLYYFLHGVKNE